ncbi:MAG: SDR family oxidoreductase, partial [Chloroflexota bacterium]
MTTENKALAGKVALVTGGAGGIGSAICKRLADAGASVIITYNSRVDKAQALADELAGENHMVSRTRVDNTEEQIALAKTIKETYGKLDILVNNAGITTPVPHHDLDHLTDTIIDDILRVNVRGVLASIRAMRELLLASDDGLVINVSSIAATRATGSNVAYCASKAALDNITMSLGRALAPDIRVVSVSPGWV